MVEYKGNTQQNLAENQCLGAEYNGNTKQHPAKMGLCGDIQRIYKENTEKIAQIEAEYKYKQAIDSANIRELKLTKRVFVLETKISIKRFIS